MLSEPSLGAPQTFCVWSVLGLSLSPLLRPAPSQAWTFRYTSSSRAWRMHGCWGHVWVPSSNPVFLCRGRFQLSRLTTQRDVSLRSQALRSTEIWQESKQCLCPHTGDSRTLLKWPRWRLLLRDFWGQVSSHVGLTSSEFHILFPNETFRFYQGLQMVTPRPDWAHQPEMVVLFFFFNLNQFLIVANNIYHKIYRLTIFKCIAQQCWLNSHCGQPITRTFSSSKAEIISFTFLNGRKSKKGDYFMTCENDM